MNILSPRMARTMFVAGIVMLIVSTVLSLVNVAAVLATPSGVSIDVPEEIGFEGYISGASGTNQTIIFKIYDADTAGNQLWSQTLNNVTIANGLYAVTLSGFDDDDFASDDRWISVTYNSVEQSPRIKISSVPFAINASNANKIGGGEVAGMIALFETPCSQVEGWHEYVPTRGRVVVGAPSEGTGGPNETVGTALTDQQTLTHTHTMPDHSHSVSRSGWGNTTIQDNGAYNGYLSASNGSGQWRIASNDTTTGAGGAGTTGSTSHTMPYVQLYYCQIDS